MKTFEKILIRCENLGINLSELCRRADVGRQTLEYWKKSEPQTLVMYFKIDEILKKLEDEHNKFKTISIEERRRYKRELPGR